VQTNFLKHFVKWIAVVLQENFGCIAVTVTVLLQIDKMTLFENIAKLFLGSEVKH